MPLFQNPHAHLLRPAVEMIEGMCEKLREACFEERVRLEQELEPYLPVVEPDIEEVREIAKELGLKAPE